MVKISYGFDARMPNGNDDPWLKLATINEFLEDGQPIPPDLAQWLGHAIFYSKNDPSEFLKRLGLKSARGRQHSRHSKNAWLEWGEKICYLEGSLGREDAIADVARQYADMHGKEPERSTLQKWRDTYAKAASASK